MQKTPNVLPLLDRYDTFLIDLWGVIHDGDHLYPHVVETLQTMREQSKRVVFLSNAPRRAKKAQARLDRFGIPRDCYEFVMTSGQQVHDMLSESPFMGRRYYYIGPEYDADLLDGLGFERVDSPDKAEFVLNVDIIDHERDDAWHASLLKPCAERGLPMLCANPDLRVVKQNGVAYRCSGHLAELYEKMGGTVRNIGKPFPEVYEHCLSKLGVTDKSKVLAIGDSLRTDIRGGRDAGLDTLLIMEGVMKEAWQNHGGNVGGMEAYCEKEGAVPTYVAENFGSARLRSRNAETSAAGAPR